MSDETYTLASLVMDRGLPLGNSEDNQGRRAFHTKVLNKPAEPVYVTVVQAPVTTDEIYRFAESLAVPPGVETTILTFVAGADTFVQRVRTSGENVAAYYAKLNGSVIDIQRSSYTQFNCDFNFAILPDDGVRMVTGDTLTVTVLHNRPTSSNHNAMLQGIQ